MFAGAPKPTIIRKVTTVPAQPKPKPKPSSQPPKPAQPSSHGSPKRPNSATASRSDATPSKTIASHGRAEKIKNERNGHLTPPPLAASKRSNKRKAPSPSLVPEFDDSSEEEESEISGATPPQRKRVRHDTLEPDLKRQVRDAAAERHAEQSDRNTDRIVHGADLTWENAKEFKSAFVLGDGDEIPILGLQYPSKYAPER